MSPRRPGDHITVALIPGAEADLRRLQEQTGLSKTDLANRAITTYEFFDAQLRAGRHLVIRDKETDDLQRVEFPTAAAELTISLAQTSAVDTKLMSTAHSDGGHVFISYVSEDSITAGRLQRDLEKAGITVWRDRASLGPGDLWKTKIRQAIRSGAFFLACFSAASNSRAKSYMNEELTLAVEELRVRSRDRVWFLPVVLPGGEVPDRPIGAGETLRDFNYTILNSETWSIELRNLVRVIKRE
jgi:hypothetical protein